MAKNSDIIKIGFDYRASLEQFEKETNGVFDGISEKAGKQKISIQLDAKNDKVIEKIKELQKLKLDKFTFEFGESGLAEQLKTFDQLEKKINEIINLSKGLGDATSKINSNQSIRGEIDAVSKLKDIVNKTTITFEDFKTIIANLPSDKIGQLNKMLDRTFELTSDVGTSLGVMTSELGKYFTITGTRSSTSFFLSNEGEFTRKPNKNKTNFVDDEIYTKGMKYDPSDLADFTMALQKQEQQAIDTAKAQEKLAETQKNLSKSTTVDNSKLKETIDYYREIYEIQRKLDDAFIQNRQLVPVSAYGFDSIEEGEKALNLCNEMIAKMKEYYSLAQKDGYGSNALKEMSSDIEDVTQNIKPAVERALSHIKTFTEQRMLDNEIGLKIDNSKSNAPKELLDEYISVISKINNGFLDGQEGINILNTKAKELGVTFDETSKKWVNVAATSSSGDINESSVQIDKLKNKLDELSQRYEELSKSTIVSGRDVDLVDNEEFQKLSKEFATLKQELSDIKIHMELFEQSAMSYDAFIPYENQISELSSRIEKLINDYRELAIVQKDLEGNKSNISSGNEIIESQNKIQEELKETQRIAEETADKINSANKNSITGVRSYWEKYGTSNSENYLNNKSDVTYNQIIKQITEQENLAKGIMKQVSKFIDPSNLLQDIDTDYFKAINLELEKLGYYLDEIKINERDHIASAKILPIDDKALTNAEEMLDILKGIKAPPIKDTFQGDAKASAEASSSAVKEEAKAMEQVAESAEKASKGKNKFSESNKKVKQSADASVNAVNEEKLSLSSMQKEIDKYNKKYKDFNRKPTDANRSNNYQSALNDYKKSIEELQKFYNTLDNSTPITSEQLSKWKELTTNVDIASDALKSFSAAKKGSTEGGRWKEIDKISKYLDKNTKISKEARQQLQGYLDLLKSGSAVNIEEIHMQFNKIAEAERRAGREGKSFFDILTNKSIYGLAARFASYYLSFMDFIRYARNGINAIRELDTALVDLQKTTTMNTNQLEDFYYASNDVAKQMGVTTSEIINQASAWSRLGYSSKEAATEMAALSSQFASISPGMDLDTATDGLVSTMKAFDIEVEDVERKIMDNINRIGNTAATSNDEIVDMLTRSSAAMAVANNTLEETIALETAAVEITRSAESTGTAFKTISMRIRGYDEETEELSEDLKNISGEIADLTKTASTPGGISLFTDENKTTYKSTYQILKEISEIYDELTDKQQADLLEKLAGKRGGQVVGSLLLNFESAEKALKEMERAAGSADAEMSIIEESIDYKLNALKETWVGNAQEMLDRGDFGAIIDGLTKLSEAIGWVIDKAGLLGTVGLGVGLFKGIKNVGIGMLVAY